MEAVPTKTRFVVLRHWKERHKTSNTARLAALAMPNLSLVDYGGPGPGAQFDPSVIPPGAWLLYPDQVATRPDPPPGTVVVLDGTWAQARRMSQRHAVLRGLPKLSLPSPPPGRKRFRYGPTPEGMNTLEAIARAVALLEGESLAAPLDRLYDIAVERMLVLRGLNEG